MALLTREKGYCRESDDHNIYISALRRKTLANYASEVDDETLLIQADEENEL